MEFSDELYHWKYIKKKKVNGKWRYYYDKTDNELTMLRKDADKAQKALDEDFDKYYRKMYGSDINKARAELETNPKGVQNVNRWYNDKSIREGTKETYRQGEYLRREARDTKNSYNSRKKSLGGKIDAFMEKHGKTIVKKLNKASNYAYKGRNAVKRLLKKLK